MKVMATSKSAYYKMTTGYSESEKNGKLDRKNVKNQKMRLGENRPSLPPSLETWKKSQTLFWQFKALKRS